MHDPRRPPLRPLPASVPLLVLGFLAACRGTGAPDAEPQAPALQHLVVLHTNDVHGQVLPRRATWLDRDDPPPVGGVARLAGEARRLAAELEAQGVPVLVLDGGDWFQGTPEGLVDGGERFLELLEGVGYDALVVGNHEFDHGVPHLAGLLERRDLPHVRANVREPLPPAAHDGPAAQAPPPTAGARVPWAVPYRVLDVGPLRVAVVGLLTTETPVITHADARELVFVDPATELDTVLGELAAVEGLDLVLPLTHLGVSTDRELARAHPELPLIVGGHSHTTLPEGVREGGTLIVQTGCKATVLGRVDLWLVQRGPDDWEVVEATSRLVELPVGDGREAPDVAALAAELTALGDAALGEVVGELPVAAWRGGGFTSGAAGNWIADAFRAKVAADVGIQNRGGIRANLPAGPLTRRDLFDILPFGNTLVVIELTGAELRETVERALLVPGHTGIEFSGLEARVRGSWPDAPELVEVLHGGVPLDLARTYRLATNSFLAGGGDGYLPESVTVRPFLDTGLVLREVLEEAVAAGLAVDETNRYVHLED